jgi:hypothetical protein
MKWEFLGIQQLRAGFAGKGHVYAMEMWRTPVPGGWLLMSVNARSSDPQPIQSFYPDPDHIWTGKTPEEANYLLRAARTDDSPSTHALLRASDDPNAATRLLDS